MPGLADVGLLGPVQPAAVQAAAAAAYWRRRFVILAIGLGILGAAAWGLSEALVLPGLRVHDASASGGDVPRRPSGRQAAAPGAGTRSSPAPGPSAANSGFGGFKPASCSWHSVVLSLSATQASYGPGQQPAFSLSVVSTQPADCSFNVGSGHLALVIKEGPARIWSSADCATGTVNLVAPLRRGIPMVVPIGWDKQSSAPGCAGAAHAVPAGRYTAYAVDGSHVSSPVMFRLG